MNEWQVIIERPAERYLAKLTVTERQSILDALLLLGTGDFTVLDIKRLRGRSDWRLRIGEYRVLFLIDSKNKMLFVTRIGSRGDIYKK
jgi:mRNA interferase RelE/StbE